MFGAKAQIAALEKGIALELVMVPFDMQRLYEPKHPDVLRINPKRQVPVLIDGPVEIFDSTQIFEYLEDAWPQPSLWPREAGKRAQARLLELKSDEIYFPHVIRLMSLQEKPDDPAAIAARAAAARYYDEIEELLAGRDYLADEYSFADIAFYMAQLFGERMGAPIPSSAARLRAWRERVSARTAVRRIVGAMAAYLISQRRPLPPFLAAIADSDRSAASV
jgi:glutathione S-transferase